MFFAVHPTVLRRAILAKILFVCPNLVFTVKKTLPGSNFKSSITFPVFQVK